MFRTYTVNQLKNIQTLLMLPSRVHFSVELCPNLLNLLPLLFVTEFKLLQANAQLREFSLLACANGRPLLELCDFLLCRTKFRYMRNL